MKKPDDLSAPHLRWLVQARMRNQNACLRLHDIFEKNPVEASSKECRAHSHSLVAAGFSLWRAAFLADRTGLQKEIFADARAFLAQLLINNAIAYPQDRAAREWTFNYYMTNAKDALLGLSKTWQNVSAVLSKKQKVTKDTTNPRRRWDRHQNAFEEALDSYEKDLQATRNAPTNTRATPAKSKGTAVSPQRNGKAKVQRARRPHQSASAAGGRSRTKPKPV